MGLKHLRDKIVHGRAVADHKQSERDQTKTEKKKLTEEAKINRLEQSISDAKTNRKIEVLHTTSDIKKKYGYDHETSKKIAENKVATKSVSKKLDKAEKKLDKYLYKELGRQHPSDWGVG